MEIVIKIDEKDYQSLKDGHIPFNVLDVIMNGTILSNGHGRLIDADALWKKWVFDAIGKQEIDDAPTIVEADRSDEV